MDRGNSISDEKKLQQNIVGFEAIYLVKERKRMLEEKGDQK